MLGRVDAQKDALRRRARTDDDDWRQRTVCSDQPLGRTAEMQVFQHTVPSGPDGHESRVPERVQSQAWICFGEEVLNRYLILGQQVTRVGGLPRVWGRARRSHRR